MLGRLLNLFYPNLCAGCQQPLSTGHSVVCVACRMQLPYTNFDSMENNPVMKAFWGRIPLISATALFYYQKHTIVQKLLHALKYKNRPDVGEMFGGEMARLLMIRKPSEPIDAIVPVPMHRSKLKTRGYNQSEILANEIAKILNKPVDTMSLKKETITNSQTQKGRFDRWRNSDENFVAFKTPYNHILLVDDVITTGATLEACAGILLKENPQLKISIISMAYTYR